MKRIGAPFEFWIASRGSDEKKPKFKGDREKVLSPN